MTASATHRTCNSKLLYNLVFFASGLCYSREALGLTLMDKARLCTEIGKQGLTSIDDRIVSDACWIFSYILSDADDYLIEQVCAGPTVQLIVAKLSSEDRNVQIPALKATANMLQCEEPQLIVDKALYEGAVEKLVALAQAPEFCRSSEAL